MSVTEAAKMFVYGDNRKLASGKAQTEAIFADGPAELTQNPAPVLFQ